MKQGRGIIAVDTCAKGQGDIAIQVGLLGLDPPSEPEAIPVLGGTCYRRHACPQASKRSQLSHTAEAPTRKRK